MQKVITQLFNRGTILPFFKEWPSTIYASTELEALIARMLSCSQLNSFAAKPLPAVREVLWADMFVKELGRENIELDCPVQVECSKDAVVSMKEWAQVEKAMYLTWFKTHFNKAVISKDKVSACLVGATLNFDQQWHGRTGARSTKSKLSHWVSRITQPENCNAVVSGVLMGLLSSGLSAVLFILLCELGLLAVKGQSLVYLCLVVHVLTMMTSWWCDSHGKAGDARVFASKASSCWDDVFETKTEADAWLLARIIQIRKRGTSSEINALKAFGSLSPETAMLILLDDRELEKPCSSALYQLNACVGEHERSNAPVEATGIPLSAFYPDVVGSFAANKAKVR